MDTLAAAVEASTVRRVFPAWSIRIPTRFEESFLELDGYWHAWDDHRSVSLTSVAILDRRDPVSAGRILRRLPPVAGSPVEDLPPGLRGWAVILPAVQPARASMALSGLLAADGRVLIATITAEDLDWAREVWRSIVHHPVPPPAPAAGGRSKQRRRG